MAIPVLPLLGMGFAAYAVYRAFRSDRRQVKSPENNWENPNHRSMRETGVWQENSNDVPEVPFRNPGGMIL